MAIYNTNGSDLDDLTLATDDTTQESLDLSNNELKVNACTPSSDGVMISSDKSKLDDIEANADVTDTANVVAALSEGSNITIETDGTISSVNTQLSNEQVQDIVGAMVTGNTETGITVTYKDFDGTLDFSVASQTDENFTTADHAKLDGIEAGATADQTASEIRSLVESASDSNVFTDADHSKLNAIEASADVTDTANVVAALTAGANVTIAADGTISSTDTNTQLSSEQVQDIVGAMVSGNSESGITVSYQDGDGTLDFSVASQTDENFTTADHAKLDGIESGATADQTKADIDALGINADQVDGLEASQFLRSDVSDVLDVGRGNVHLEDNANDNQNGSGITIRCTSNPSGGSESGGSVGSIFAVRSSGQACRLWVGQSETTTGDNDFVTNDAQFDGDISVTSNTNSSSTTTGSIQTDGGLGVALDSYFGKLINTGLGDSASAIDSTLSGSQNTSVSVLTSGKSVSGSNSIIGHQIYDITASGLNYHATGIAISDVDSSNGGSTGLWIKNIKSSSSSATGRGVYGIRIDDLDSNSSAANTYGLFIDNIASTGGGDSFSIYSESAAPSRFNGRIYIDDDTDSTSTTTGSIQTDGGLGVAKDIVVGSEIKFDSSGAGITQNSTSLGLKLATYSNTYGIGVQSSVQEYITASSSGDHRWGYGTSGSLTEVMFLDSGTKTLSVDNISVDGDTDSTSTTTGSLQTDGGIGVAKKGYFGGGIQSNAKITAQPSSSAGTALQLFNSAGSRGLSIDAPADGNTGDPWIFSTSNSIQFKIDSNEKLTIDAAGNIIANGNSNFYLGGITNTGNNGLRLHKSSSGQVYVDYKGSGNINIRADNNNGSTPRISINAGTGKVTVNEDLQVNGSCNLTPSGMITAYGGSSAPSGYLMCNGASVSTSTYSDLFSVIGYTYGGSGSSFKVPDLRQRFPLGKASSGTGSTLGSTGGEIDHDHSVNPPGSTTSGPSGTVGKLNGFGAVAGSNHTHPVDIGTFSSGDNNPPYLTLNYIIKT